jgi:membrane-associated phospholipid phosphatase
MDQSLFTFLFSLSQSPAVAAVSLFISNILIYLLFAVIIISFLYKARPLFLHLFLLGGTAASAVIVSKIIKTVLQVDRPFVALHLTPLFYETGFSLPSTHATLFAALSVLALTLNRRLGLVFLTATVLIGISRVVLGVHYPSDVLAGFMLGALIGLIFVKLGKHPRIVAFFGKRL